MYDKCINPYISTYNPVNCRLHTTHKLIGINFKTMNFDFKVYIPTFTAPEALQRFAKLSNRAYPQYISWRGGKFYPTPLSKLHLWHILSSMVP